MLLRGRRDMIEARREKGMQQETYFIKDKIKNRQLSVTLKKTYLEEDFPLHCHDFTEMLIVLGGTAQHIVENTTYKLRPGDICIIKPSVHHGFAKVNHFLHCNITFDADRVFEGFKTLSLLPGFQVLFAIEMNLVKEEAYKSMIRLDTEDIAFVDKITNLMLEEERQNLPGYEVVMRSLFLELAVFCARKYHPDAENVPENIDHLAHTVIYMEKHFKENLTLEKLAQMSCLSPRHFDRIFKRIYKTTPLSYIAALRMGEACRMLKTTELPVSEIARACGFSDGNYFARTFRRQKGISPGAYRKLRSVI